MKSIITIAVFLLSYSSFAQSSFVQQQYFDGADTLFEPGNPLASVRALRVEIDTTANNSWQIGTPQKILFSEAATFPNAIITDTLEPYPTNDSSYFSFDLEPTYIFGVKAIQWKQKIDFEYGKDGGRIELSTDSGQTWQSVFDNPLTYNFYGFDSTNVDTLADGDFAFTGTDSVWRDVWLCFDDSWIYYNDGLRLRFVSVSDSVETNQEGWIIDNLIVHKTLIHTGITEKKGNQYFKIYPNPAQDRLFIDLKKLNEYHLIEHMVLMDAQGKQLQEWKNVPTHFFIDTKMYGNGNYFLKIRTNKAEETLPVIIQR